MGFADYLSRKPTGEAFPPSDEHKNLKHKINTIEETKFFLLRNALTPNGANKSTNQNTDIKQGKNDAIIPKRVSSKTNNAFCLNTRAVQSTFISQFPISNYTNSEITYKPVNQNIVGITTRRNPTKDTFNIPIERRYRAQNKKHQMEQPSISKLFTNSSTQTD